MKIIKLEDKYPCTYCKKEADTVIQWCIAGTNECVCDECLDDLGREEAYDLFGHEYSEPLDYNDLD